MLLVLLAAAPACAEDAAAGDPARGEAAFADHCTACHASVSRLVRRIPKTDQAEASLDAFLAGHHAPGPATRADIVAYLLSQ
jgi:mono/diheme cytochrome c family protein